MKKHLAFICLCLTFFASTPTASAETAQVRLPASRFYDSLYNLADVLVPGQEGIGTVTALWTANPFVDVKLVDEYGKFVSFEIASGSISDLAADGHAYMFENTKSIQSTISAAQQNAIVLQIVNTAISGLAGGSDYAPAKNSNWQVYLTPYGASASNRQSNSYGGNMGVNGGINYIFNEKFTLGVYFDLGASRTSADLFDSETNSDYGALGLSASYRLTPYWYVRGSLGGAWTSSQQDYIIDSFSGDTSYNTSAFMAELATGYVFKINDNHAITPEVGLSYLYMHTNAYDMNVPDYPIYNMSYDAVSHDALYGTLSLRWDGMFNITDETIFTPHVKVGVRQNLSGHELTADLRIFGEKFTSKSTSDMTTAIVNAGFGIKKGNFSVNVDYNGEYGHEQTSHGGSINFIYEF